MLLANYIADSLNKKMNTELIYHGKSCKEKLSDIPIVNQNKDILSMTRNLVISSLESEICKSF